MARSHVAPLKWHYVALSGTVLEGAYLRKPGQKTSYDKRTKGQVHSRPVQVRNGRGH